MTSVRKTYIIEHMEADETEGGPTLPPWVVLEYTHISQFVRAIFSSLSAPSAAVLTRSLPADTSSLATTDGIDSLVETWSRGRVCLLDPRAERELSPDDADLFDALLFGGILGDHPPRDRTGELRRLKLPSRHLGPIQMTTDTAVLVCQRVLEHREPLDALPFVDHPEIELGPGESVEMPFRYLTDEKGRPRLPDGMREHLSKDLDRSFEV